jgi:hypothetical protein
MNTVTVMEPPVTIVIYEERQRRASVPIASLRNDEVDG